MDRLSPELLLEIFDLAVHSPDPSYSGFPTRLPTQNDTKPSRYFTRDDTYPSHPPGISAHEANTTSPVHLTHVCQTWRAVALSHRRLWSTVYVTDGRRGCVEEFGAWMERSEGWGLKIVFRDGGEPTANIEEEEEELGSGWYAGPPYFTIGNGDEEEEWEEEEEEEEEDRASESGSEEREGQEREKTPLTEEEEGENVISMLKLAVAHRCRWESFKLRLRRIRLEIDPSHEILQEAVGFKFNESLGGAESKGATDKDLKDEAKEKEKENSDPLKTFVLDIPYPKTESDYISNLWYQQDSDLQDAIVRKCPCLDELQLWDVVQAGFERYIPYARITKLTLHKAWLSLYDKFLPTSFRQFKVLRTLNLALSERQDQHQPHGKLLHSITLPALENLNLVGHCSLCANNILSMLQLPALVDLSVHTNSSRGGDRELRLPAFLDMWSPGSLRRLALRDEEAVGFEGRYSALLKHQALQGLRELRLGGVVTKTVFDLLAPQDEAAAPLLPSLEHVHFEVALSNSTPASCPLTRLALARSSPSHPTLSTLKQIQVGFQRKEDLEAATACWASNEETNSALRKVDKRFSFVGTGPWTLEREFVVEDFSLIQGWKERARPQW